MVHFDEVDAVIHWALEQDKGHKFKIGFTGHVVKIIVDPSPTPKWGRIQYIYLYWIILSINKITLSF